MTETERSAYETLCYYALDHHAPAFIHQYIVDAYAAQHASELAKPITITFALVGLYLHVEMGWSGKQVQIAHMRLAKRRKTWPRFASPDDRGEITVLDVVAVPPGPDRDRMIDCWCRSIWNAYRAVHIEVKELVQLDLWPQ